MQVIDGLLTVGGLIAFNMLSGRVNAPILKLASLWQELQQMRVAVKRIGGIMNALPEPGHALDRAQREPLRGCIHAENVSFSYRPGAPAVLRELSFVIPAGQVVGVVGVSGAGKTTLIRLLQRLYLPCGGRILIDGVDLATADAAWLRRQTGVVSQDAALMNLSVRDNIALSDPELSFDAVVAAAQLAGAHDFINGLPQGYETMVGERGSLLSGGQRARIAIARALAGNPRLLLLDEATSALDYESERAIQQNMRLIAKDRTVLTIAHRLSAVRNADRIITIDHGRVVKDGHHDELIRTGGRYATLHRLQGGSMKSH